MGERYAGREPTIMEQRRKPGVAEYEHGGLDSGGAALKKGGEGELGASKASIRGNRQYLHRSISALTLRLSPRVATRACVPTALSKTGSYTSASLATKLGNPSLPVIIARLTS